MKDIKKNIKSEKEKQDLQKRKNEEVDFKDYHRFVYYDHSGSCCGGGDI